MARSSKDWIPDLFGRPAGLKRVLFRVDAGRVPGLSFGHLSRCLLLARMLREIYGCKSYFLMHAYPEGINQAKLAGEDVEVIPRPRNPEEEEKALKNTVSKLRPDAVVIDLPYDDISSKSFPEIHKAGAHILYIDDSRFMVPEGADAYWNSSILAAKRMRRAKPGVRLFLGKDYFLFDDDLTTPRPARKKEMRLVLITFGGSDPTGLTLRVMRTLGGREWKNTDFKVILGPGFAEGAEARALIRGNMEIVTSPPDIFPHFLSADLVICGGGRTLYELLHLGIDAFPVATAPHEAEIVREMLAQGLVRRGLEKWDHELFLADFSGAVQSLA